MSGHLRKRVEEIKQLYPELFFQVPVEHHEDLAKLHDAALQHKQDAGFTLDAVSGALSKHPQHAGMFFELAHAALQHKQSAGLTLVAVRGALSEHPQHPPEQWFKLVHAALQHKQSAWDTLVAVRGALSEHPQCLEQVVEVVNTALESNLSAAQAVRNYVKMLEKRRGK